MSPMSFVFDPQQALTLLSLAEAAYDLTKLPAGWKLIGPLEPEDFGFVATKDGLVYIGFRGTHKPEDVVTDIDILPAASLYSMGEVSKGTQDAYTSVRPSLIELMAEAEATVPVGKGDLRMQVVILGHSLGGNLATHCASDRMLAGVDRYPVLFASPKTGDRTFAEDFDAKNPNCWRIVNKWDTINLWPYVSTYQHVKNEVVVDGGMPPPETFVTSAHSLSGAYRVGLEKMVEEEAAGK